jgi:hypothetical protein
VFGRATAVSATPEPTSTARGCLNQRVALAGARARGCTKAVEAPVRIRQSFANSEDRSAVCRVLLDTIAISYRRYILDSCLHAGDRSPLA